MSALTNAQRLRRNLMARRRRARLTGRPVGRARPTNGRRRGALIPGGGGRRRRKIVRRRRRRRPINGRFKGRMLRGFIPGTRRRRRARAGRRVLTRAQKNRRNLLARQARARRTGRPVGRARPARRRRRRPVNGRFRGRLLRGFIPGTRIRRRARLGVRRRRAPRRALVRRRPTNGRRRGVGGAAIRRRFPLPPPLPLDASEVAIALREDQLRLRRNRMAREAARRRTGRRAPRVRRGPRRPPFTGFVPRELPAFRGLTAEQILGRPTAEERRREEAALAEAELRMEEAKVEQEEEIFPMGPPPQEPIRERVRRGAVTQMKRKILLLNARLGAEQDPAKRRAIQDLIGKAERTLGSIGE